MSDETRRVLELLSQGKVTVDEAQKLLQALTEPSAGAEVASLPPGTATAKPRFIRIHVHKPAREGHKAKDVNIRVPMAVVRGGMRLGTIIPGWQQWMGSRVKDRGMDFDFSKLDPAALESMLSQMGEINIDNGNGEQVRITCE